MAHDARLHAREQLRDVLDLVGEGLRTLGPLGVVGEQQRPPTPRTGGLGFIGGDLLHVGRELGGGGGERIGIARPDQEPAALRRQGIGRALVTAAGHEAAAQGVATVQAHIQGDNAVAARDEPLGWCHGLAFAAGLAWVGFTRIRATRARERLYVSRALVRSAWGAPSHNPASRFLDNARMCSHCGQK